MWLIRYPLNILCASLPAGWLSWFGNSLVMFVLYRQRATLQSTDLLTLNLAISDASISIFGYSRGILEIFNIFKDDGYLITWIWTCQVKAKLEQDFKILTFGTTSRRSYDCAESPKNHPCASAVFGQPSVNKVH